MTFLTIPQTIFNISLYHLQKENYELRQDVTRLQNLLIKTRKENSRQNIKIQEDHKKQLQAQSQVIFFLLLFFEYFK